MLYVVLGKSNAGKTTFANYLSEKLGVEKVITCTSRPRRSNEADGVDYHFLDKEDAIVEIENGKFVEHCEFNGWIYGTRFEDIDISKNQMIVLNPEGYENVKKFYGDKVISIYMEPSFFVRIKRIIRRDRGNYKEAMRRFMTDSKDFKDIKADVVLRSIDF